jgi:hypothetical protein
VSFHYAYASGIDLLRDKAVTAGSELALGPWDVAIVEEKSPLSPVVPALK